METIISILTRFVADAAWCCAVVAALSLGCAVVWKWQNLAEGLKGEPKTFRAVFVAMLVVAATLFSKVDPNGAPPNLNTPLSGTAPMLQIGAPDDSSADVAKFFAINWTTNGVDLVLHRPPELAVDAVEVTLVGSTNLVTATWEPFTNVVFAAGETNIAVRVDSAQLDAHSVSNMCFFAFINSGDTDEDGLADWDERFNLKIDSDDPDSDGDGMPDGWEWDNGLNPGDPQDAWLDYDEDGLSNWMEYALGLLPCKSHSFDDGVDDWDWIEWGGGPPFSDSVTVQLSVGDPSGSSSERWKLVLEEQPPGGRRYVVLCSQNGDVAQSTLHLERGRDYIGRIEHLGSFLFPPDYDWAAQIGDWPSTLVLPQGGEQAEDSRYLEDHAQSFVVDNLSGLLGVCDDSFGAYDNSVGKTFLVHTAKTQVEPARICVPCGFAFRTSFSLSADSDPLADWTIEPVTPGGPRLYASSTGGEGATSLQGVSRVYVSAGADAALYSVTARHPRFENLHSSAEFAVCRFQVEGVRFNTDECSSAMDAISIRSDYDVRGFDYETGEWADGGRVNFPVCYKGGILPFVQARFSVTPAITVSARFFALQTTSFSPLGGLNYANVDFVGGVSAWTDFAETQQIETKVRRSEAVFDWHLSGIDGVSFLPSSVGTTGPHRVYTILADPVEPWSAALVEEPWYSWGETESARSLAWTNALEWACLQAEGTVDESHCASNVVSAIYSCARFSYDIEHGMSYFTLDPKFDAVSDHIVDLSGCIKTLNSHSRPSPVNCTDCASFVTSFANLLGCELYSSKMGSHMSTYPYCAIGRQPWTAPSWGWNFNFHEVAWSGNCSYTDLVFDACLRYDGDDNPGNRPLTAVTPGGVVFSDVSSGATMGYRDFLVPASSLFPCLPLPQTKVRRKLR